MAILVLDRRRAVWVQDLLVSETDFTGASTVVFAVFAFFWLVSV
jgi:hypothetical protein